MSPNEPRVLVYGATGYTGRLIAAEAARREAPVVLAGRDRAKLDALAAEHDGRFETRVVALDDAVGLSAALQDVAAVLHVAGPFSATAEPMREACLATGTHYLDVTGEIDVFEAHARSDDDAKRAGIALLPGVGFDVVPTDCLANDLAARVEAPRRLRLALAGVGGGVSRGTAKSSVEALGAGLRVRRDGILVRRPPGSLERHFDFGAGPARALALPLGEVSTCFHSTGIPDVEAYLVVSGRIPAMLRASRWLAPLLRRRFVQDWLKRRADAGPEGPDADALDATRAFVLGEVEDEGGRTVRGLLETASPYRLTQRAALEAALRVARGEVEPGFQTPATAFEADFVLGVEGSIRRDLD